LQELLSNAAAKESAFPTSCLFDENETSLDRLRMLQAPEVYRRSSQSSNMALSIHDALGISEADVFSVERESLLNLMVLRHELSIDFIKTTQAVCCLYPASMSLIHSPYRLQALLPSSGKTSPFVRGILGCSGMHKRETANLSLFN